MTIFVGSFILSFSSNPASRLEASKSVDRRIWKHKTCRFRTCSSSFDPSSRLHSRNHHHVVSCSRNSSRTKGWINLKRKLLIILPLELFHASWRLVSRRNLRWNDNKQGAVSRRFRDRPNVQNLPHSRNTVSGLLAWRWELARLQSRVSQVSCNGYQETSAWAE